MEIDVDYDDHPLAGGNVSWLCPFFKRDPIHCMDCIAFNLKPMTLSSTSQRKHCQPSIYYPICQRDFSDVHHRDSCTEFPCLNVYDTPGFFIGSSKPPAADVFSFIFYFYSLGNQAERYFFCS